MEQDLELLVHRVRPAESAEPEGALVLFHGRGADEGDLFPLLDIFDPDRRLVGLTPRAPLQLPPGGFHWYAMGGIPKPERTSFLETTQVLDRWLAAVAESFGVDPARSVLGGFSQGTVMAYAMALGKGRPRPAGLMAFSGFIPVVEGFPLDFENLEGFPVVIAHGALDTVIPVRWGRQAGQRLEAAGVRPAYREFQMGHGIDPQFAQEISGWVGEVMPPL